MVWGYGRSVDPRHPGDPDPFESRWRNRVRAAGRIGAPILLGLIALSAFLSVNTFPVISNDSVLYLDHSRDLAEGGWVTYGYRQVGYPLVLALSRWTANLIGAEPLIFTAVSQRLLLAASVVLAWWYWRWWALPFFAVLLAAHTIAYSNFLLTEGLAMPMSALMVFPTVQFVRVLRSETSVDKTRRLRLLGSLIVVGVLVLYSLRFTFVVFGFIPLWLVVASWRTAHRRLALTMGGALVVLGGLFTVAVTSENQREVGVFTPSAGGEVVRYYFAWRQVFTVHPENSANPELAEYFDGGVVHDFSREVSGMDLLYVEQVAVFDREIESMLDAAGMPILGSKVRAVFFALAGGRLDDLKAAVEAVVASRRPDVDGLINLNQFAAQNGADAFADEYNDSQLPEAVITDPIGALPPIPPTRSVVRVLLPLALVVMLAGLLIQRTRLISMIGLSVMVSFAAGVGWLRADNLRFLMPPSVFALGVGCATFRIMIGDYFGSGAPRNPSLGKRTIPFAHREHPVAHSIE